MTDSDMARILKDMVVITDTREQKNQHILDYFMENKIPYKTERLKTADYSFCLPNYSHLELDGAILVEKKNSLDEICGNFTKERERFAREFERIQSEHIHLVIENATWKKVLNGSYRSQLNPKSLMASMITWNIRYNCPIWFVGVDESPALIYNILYYELFEHLKGLREEEDV